MVKMLKSTQMTRIKWIYAENSMKSVYICFICVICVICVLKVEDYIITRI